MSVVAKTRDHLSDLMTKVITNHADTGSAQTVTISRPRAEVEQFWRDPENLSRVLGDLASIREAGDDVHEWTVHHGTDEITTWRSALRHQDGTLDFETISQNGSPAEDRPRVRLEFRDAPNNLGTEVRLAVRTPIPELLTRAAVFKALYRARALLQTGEIPTLEHNPSARHSASSARRKICVHCAGTGSTISPWKPSTIPVCSIPTTPSCRSV